MYWCILPPFSPSCLPRFVFASLDLPPLSLFIHFQHICSLSISSLCSVGRQPEVQPGDKVAVLQLRGGHLHSLPCPQVPVQGQLRAPQQVWTSFWFSFIIELKHTVSQQIGLTLSSVFPPLPCSSASPLLLCQLLRGGSEGADGMLPSHTLTTHARGRNVALYH